MPLAPVQVRLGPAGSGKTRGALRRCGSGCCLVVPSESAAALSRPQLAEGGCAHTFRSLAEAITGPGARQIASPALRAFFLREAVRQSVAPGSYFAAAAPRPGFAPAVGDLIREFKQAGATPVAFRAAASRAAAVVEDPRFAEKCESLADIWTTYDELLSRHHLRDTDDLLAEAIEQAGAWRSSLHTFLVDGFTAFTPQQIGLLAALRAAGAALEIYLTHDPERPVLFARSTRTLEDLRAHLAPLEECVLPERAYHLKSPSLRHLERHLFAPADPVACDESITLFEAPDPVMEAEMVARAIHRLHHQEGVPLERIAIVQRRLDGAATLLLSTFARYEIPVAFHAGVPLAENPLVSLVASLLRLFLEDWPRAELVRCARSSYFGLPPEEADHLERLAIARGVRGGRETWFRLADRPELSGGRLSQWLGRLRHWQQRLDRQATPMVHAKLIAQTAGHFGLTRAAKEGDPLLAGQDERAWDSACSLLREIAHVENLASAGETTFATFAGAVLAGWQSGLFTVPPPAGAHVEILEAFDARQQEFEAVFLMGLNERVFPRVVADNPFLRDDERQALAAAGGGLRLDRQVERADEERVLFYRVITAPQRKLVCTYTRTGADGRQALPSYYLEEVRGVFAAGEGAPVTVTRTLADVVPDPDEAVGVRERALCASAALAGHRPLPDEKLAVLLATLAAEKPVLFTDLRDFLRVRPGHDLASPRLRAWARQQVSSRAFSASELEAYLACPHRHFLGYQLRLQEITEEAGAADIGSLLHAVLRTFFANRRAEANGSTAPLPEDAADQLAAILDELLSDYISDPRPSRVQMIRHAAREYLARFVEQERQYFARTGLVPTHFELAFGPQPDHEGDRLDAGSLATPLRISAPAGSDAPAAEAPGESPAAVELAGTIDRVDLTPDGQAAVVIDYKLSRTTPLREMLAGTSLQVPIYLLAMEQLFGQQVVAAVQHPLRKGEPYWVFRPGLVPGLTPGKGDGLPTARYASLLATAQAAILRAACGIRDGHTLPALGDACELCSFTEVCRPDDVANGQSDETQAPSP